MSILSVPGLRASICPSKVVSSGFVIWPESRVRAQRRRSRRGYVCACVCLCVWVGEEEKEEVVEGEVEVEVEVEEEEEEGPRAGEARALGGQQQHAMHR